MTSTLLAGLLACSGDPPEAPVPEPVDCASLTSIQERDQCLWQEISELPSDQSALVLDKAKGIQDAMVLGSAVDSWIRAHAGDLRREEGMALCNLLSGPEQLSCRRRLLSPHLQH